MRFSKTLHLIFKMKFNLSSKRNLCHLFFLRLSFNKKISLIMLQLGNSLICSFLLHSEISSVIDETLGLYALPNSLLPIKLRIVFSWSSARWKLGQADFPRWVGFDPLHPILIVAIPDAETVGATSTQACHFQKREREEDTILAFIPSKPLVTIQNDEPISNKRLCF